jgi:hypothetical protein
MKQSRFFDLIMAVFATILVVSNIASSAKISVEMLMTSVTYAVVGALKKAESEDYYDRGTNFNPFLV